MDNVELCEPFAKKCVRCKRKEQLMIPSQIVT